MKIRLLDKNNRGMSVYTIMLFVFVVLKIYRNTINFSIEQNGGFWNIIVCSFVLNGFIYFLTSTKLLANKVICSGIFLSIIIFINGVIRIESISFLSIYYLLVSTFYVFVIILFYYKPIDIEKKNECQWLGLIMLLILVFLIITFSRYFSLYKYAESSDHISLDNSYYGLCLLPFVLKYRSKYTIPNLFLIFANVIISSKRAGLIALLFALILYYYETARLSRNFNKRIKYLFIGLGAIILFVLAFFYIDKKYSLNLLLRFSNLVSGGGSGRTEIYSAVYDEIKNSNFIDQVLGHGLTSITRMPSMRISSAHNDFLNICYDSGILSGILYLKFLLTLFSFFFKMRKNNYCNTSIFASSLVICAVLTAFTSFFCSVSCSILFASYWGMELRDFDNFLKDREYAN